MKGLMYLSAAVALLLAFTAQAGDMKHGGIVVKDAWSRATPARSGVTYLTVFNHGEQMDRLVDVESPVARKAELHAHLMKDDVMRMRKVDGIEVHPGEPAVLAPGGNHVMLMGLHAALKEGQTFPVTLNFEKAGKITVEVRVSKAGAMKPGNRDTHGGGHKRGS